MTAGRPRLVTAEVLSAVAHLGASGAANALNVTRAAIYVNARRYGIELVRISPSRITREVLEQCAAEGLSQKEARVRLGVRGVSNMSLLCKKHGVPLGKFKWAKKSDPRADVMATLYREGYTLQQIGELYKITRERVRQLLSKYHGMDGASGGQHVLADRRARKVAAARDAKCLKKYGCSWDQWDSLRGVKPSPLRAYTMQRRNAIRRGIGWEFGFWQWWMLWQESGRWNQRGRGQGYVMCRVGDEGPYAPGNVFIATARENCSNRKGKRSGLPIGVHKCRHKYQAVRVIDGVQFRSPVFDRPELAHAAYLSFQPAPTEQRETC